MVLRKGRWIGVLGVVLGIAAWVGAAPAAEAAGCPNELLRAGVSGLLPECRAYEMVSPPDKANSDVEVRTMIPSLGVAGLDEDGYAFLSFNGLPGSESGALSSGNVAKRGSDGWTTVPFAGPTVNHGSFSLQAMSLLISRDLNKVLIASLAPLTPDSQPGENLYVRTLSPPSLQLITRTPIPVVSNFYTVEPISMVGASDDFSHLVFLSKASLTPDSPALDPFASESNLYEWDGSTLRNIGIPPGETEPFGTGIDRGIVVSADGERVVFQAKSKLYLRDHGTTIELGRPAPGVVEPFAGVPTWGGASRDVSSVFFRSAANLTADAFTGENSSGQKNLAPNLYRYDVDTGELTDLTVDRTDELGANVKGMNVAVSPNGEVAFFVAGGVLAPGATLGASNLYRWTAAGGIEFIVKLASNDPFVVNEMSWRSDSESFTDSDGATFVFPSFGGLTNGSPVGVRELYRWSTTEGLTCVSCAPGVLSPTGTLVPATAIFGGVGHSPMSADGSKVFFSTTDKLVPQDTNGKLDAYEWANGQIHLISTGGGDTGAEFLATSPSAKDVFFVTRDRLLPADRDENTDVYDAREGGGFPEPAVSVPCEAEACRPPLEAAPPTPQVGSRSFDGPPNAKPTTQKKKHHKNKKKQQKKKHHKKGNKCKPHAKKCQRKSHGHTAGKGG